MQADDAVRTTTFTQRVVIVAGIALAGYILLELFEHAAHLLLMAFAGLLVACILRAVSVPLSNVTGMRHGYALTIVIISLLSVFVAVGVVMGPQISTQFNDLRQKIPQAVDAARDHLAQYSWGPMVIRRIDQATTQPTGETAEVAMQAQTMLSSVLDIISGFLIIVFVGLYFAVSPGKYLDGLIALLPPAKRPPVEDAFNQTGDALRKWLVGTLFNMTVVGVVVTAGLYFLDVPLALGLGLLTFVFEFVPYVGPILAAIPCTLMALTVSPLTALFVILLFIVVETLEGYVLTPLVMGRAVDTPPALTVLAVVLFGVFFGTLGVALATPLTAAVLVLVRRLYVRPIEEQSDKLMDLPDEDDEDEPKTLSL